MTLREIIEQLELCEFECKDGSLEDNAQWIELKERAEKVLFICEKIKTPYVYSPNPDDDPGIDWKELHLRFYKSMFLYLYEGQDYDQIAKNNNWE